MYCLRLSLATVKCEGLVKGSEQSVVSKLTRALAKKNKFRSRLMELSEISY